MFKNIRSLHIRHWFLLQGLFLLTPTKPSLKEPEGVKVSEKAQAFRSKLEAYYDLRRPIRISFRFRSGNQSFGCRSW